MCIRDSVYAFYENLVVQNGGKESKKLFEYAQSYVMHRFEMLMVEQLAREKVPRNTCLGEPYPMTMARWLYR